MKHKNCIYLPEDNDYSRFGTSVTTIGTQYVEAGQCYPPENHPEKYMFNPMEGRVLDEYQMVFLTEGHGAYHDAFGKRYHLHAGSVFFVFPGVWHSYVPDRDSGWREFFIGFRGPLVDKIVMKGLITPEHPVFDMDVNEELFWLYRRSWQTAKEQKPGYQQYLAGLLLHSLGLVNSLCLAPTVEQDVMSHRMDMVKMHLLAMIGKNVDFEQLASNLSMSYSTFRKAFKDHVGMPPARYLQELRLKEACEQLRGSNNPVKEIAFNLNFKSLTLFCSIFKKRIGMTPMEYRNAKNIDRL